MRTLLASVSLSVFLGGCDGVTVRLLNLERDMSDISDMLPDMLLADASCQAGKGLRGKVFTCVDFANTSIVELQSAGWNFPICTPSTPASVSWEIAQGRLQLNIVDYSTFKGACQFSLPAISNPDISLYKSFTIAIAHTLSLNDGSIASVAPQLALLSLGSLSPSRFLSEWSGKLPSQTNTTTISKLDLPTGINPFQFLFGLNAPVISGAGYTGWHIASIAIVGNQ